MEWLGQGGYPTIKGDVVGVVVASAAVVKITIVTIHDDNGTSNKDKNNNQ